MRAERLSRSSASPPPTSPAPPSPPSSSTPSPPSTTRSTGPYNTICQFIKLLKYDKAELTEVEAILKPARKCDVCSSLGAKPCARCKNTLY